MVQRSAKRNSPDMTGRPAPWPCIAVPAIFGCALAKGQPRRGVSTWHPQISWSHRSSAAAGSFPASPRKHSSQGQKHQTAERCHRAEKYRRMSRTRFHVHLLCPLLPMPSRLQKAGTAGSGSCFSAMPDMNKMFLPIINPAHTLRQRMWSRSCPRFSAACESVLVAVRARWFVVRGHKGIVPVTLAQCKIAVLSGICSVVKHAARCCTRISSSCIRNGLVW